MSFSSTWLTLREPIDNAARNSEVLARVLHYLEDFDKPNLTDIGTGTGSTLRALTPHLSKPVCWHLIDNDAVLLEEATKEAQENDVKTSLIDLSKTFDGAFDDTSSLVTTSAFLDLVSEDWLEGFVSELSSKKLPFYGAITYDGRAGLLPPLEEDDWVLQVFNAHQKTDKGFGPALGPDAAECAVDLFAKAGYEIESGLSDWQAGPHHKAFQTMLLDGWKDAAKEMRPDQAQEFDDWFLKRQALIEEADQQGTSLFVGHVDFFAKPL